MILTSFDPAVHHVGWALFSDRRLVSCDLERREPLGPALVELAGSLLADCVVVEVPQVYQQRHWRGDPNDLLDVAVVAGSIAQAFVRSRVELVRPHAWKGSTPKDIMLRRIRERLDADEQVVLHTAKAPASMKHNVVDAVGLGLHALGRLR